MAAEYVLRNIPTWRVVAQRYVLIRCVCSPAALRLDLHEHVGCRLLPVGRTSAERFDPAWEADSKKRTCD